MIAKDAQWSYHYALYVLKAAWPEGEAAIATKSAVAYHYAKEVLEAPFPLGEKVIAKDGVYYKQYRMLFTRPAFFTY